MIGVVHPGDMGAAVAACLMSRGHAVAWASAGRSAATRQRVDGLGLVDVGTLDRLRDDCEVLVSVCPPHAAEDLARAMAGFAGTYVDANAVSPATAARVRALVSGEAGAPEARGSGGARFVDGGIVGPPPRSAGTTRLYLSGGPADDVAALVAGSALEPVVLPGDGPAGDFAASALKMSYASWTKGTVALLLAVRAVARAHGVEEALVAEWARSLPDLPGRSAEAARLGLERGWRWSYELAETGRTAAAIGLPEGFGAAAAQVYARLAAQPAGPGARAASGAGAQAEADDIGTALRLILDGDAE